MEKVEIKKKLKDLVNDPNYEFHFQMAGAGTFGGEPRIKCGVCEEMVHMTVQTLYHKTEPKSVSFCSSCYQLLMED